SAAPASRVETLLTGLSRSLCSRAIKTNQDLLPETPWTNIFYDDFWGTLLTHSGSHKSYRPLCTLSFRLNHAVGGLEPWGYHLVNVALHGAVTGLFTCLARLLLGGGLWSLLAGLLFASHPIHTEAVAGVVGRADEGAALFFLLSLLCYVRHCGLRGHAGPWRPLAWLLGSLGCAACSMLWKELGVTVLAVSALYDVCIFHKLKLRQIITLLHKVNGLVTSCGDASFFFFACILFLASAPQLTCLSSNGLSGMARRERKQGQEGRGRA
uniref:Uncharacterized protein n=1 Tax=Salarias fasciatus TaxID=181472 RepID=A0A672G7T0_SALFA